MLTSNTNKGDFELLDNNRIAVQRKNNNFAKNVDDFKLVKYQNRNTPAKQF